jgi:hypothetical protein
LVVAAVLVMLGAGAAAPAHGASPASASPRFSTQGRWVVDREGRTLLLRGADMMGAEYTPTDRPLPWDASDLHALRATGATVVRIPIAWANIEPQRGQYDAAALARITTIVRWAADAGLLIVLDMHQWYWSPCFGGNGMPEWATSPCPHTSYSESNPALIFAAETAFWRSKSLQASFVGAWAQAAAAAVAAHTDNVVAYDLMNEPPVGLIPPVGFDNAILAPFYERTAAAVRAVDPGALIMVEPALGSAAMPGLLHLSIDRVVYSTHLYSLSFNDAAYHAGDFGGPAQFRADLALGQLEAKNIGAAFWPGEWGYLDPGQQLSFNEPKYARDMLRAQDSALVGSAYWTYARRDPSWNPTIVSVLTRPSPFAIAGTLLSMRSSPTRLAVTWRQVGSADSRLSVPAGWHPVVTASPDVTATVTPGGWIDLSAPPDATVSVIVTNESG